MNTCSSCGAEFEGNACPHCTAEVEKVEKVEAEATEATPEAVTEAPAETQGTDKVEKKPNGFKRFMSMIGRGIVKGFKATMSFLGGKVVSSIVYALPYFAFILFNVLVWMFFSAPIQKIEGESVGSFYDFAFGNSLLSSESVLGFGFIFTIAVLSTLVALFMAVMLAIPGLRRKPVRFFGEYVSLASLFLRFSVVFYAIFMIFGIIISSYSKLSIWNLDRGGCGPLFTVFSIIFLLHVGVALLASWYNKKYNSSKPEIAKLFDDMDEPKVKVEKAEAPKAEPKEPVPVPELEEVPNYDIPKSRFTGGAFANFFMNLLVYFVTVISIGLAGPGINVIKQKWIAKHTTYDNRQIVFDGRGIQLFGRIILWGLLSIITFGFYFTFLLPAAIERWYTKHTHFADTPAPAEGQEAPESKFDGGSFGYWGVSFVAIFVSMITLGIGSFWAHCWQERWIAKHKVIDGERLYFNGTGMQYFGKKIVWLLLTVVTLGIYSFWLAVKQINWTVSHTHLDSVKDDIEAKEKEISDIKARNKAKIKAAKAQARMEGRAYAGDSFERDSKAGFIMSIIAIVLAGIFAIASIFTGGAQAVIIFAALEVKIFSGIALAFSIREKSIIGVILSAIAVMIV